MSDDEPSSGGSERPAGPEFPAAAAAPAVSSAASDPLGTTDPGHAADGQGDGLVLAVDALSDVSTEPVHTHATRYQQVHALLQDALSATDRPGS